MGYLEWDVRDLLAHGECMSYRIPIGTEIFPYSSESGGVGIGRLTTVEVELDDTAQRLTLPDPVTGEHAEFFCLPLGENPTLRPLPRPRT